MMMRVQDHLAISMFLVTLLFLIGVLFDGVEKWMCYARIKDLGGAWITATVILFTVISSVVAFTEYLSGAESSGGGMPAPKTPPARSKTPPPETKPPPNIPEPQKPPSQPQPTPAPQPEPKPEPPVSPTTPSAPSPPCVPRKYVPIPAEMPACDFCGYPHPNRNCQPQPPRRSTNQPSLRYYR